MRTLDYLLKRLVRHLDKSGPPDWGVAKEAAAVVGLLLCLAAIGFLLFSQ